MCLIYVAWRRHPRYRLVVAANRDEYHARPAAPAHWWEDAPGVLAGRDLEAGGTWMGITRGGRFAAVTNYRDSVKSVPGTGRGATASAGAPSRGALVGAFLSGDESAPAYLDRVAREGHRYNGFSLLAMDGETLAFASNRARGVTLLEPGVFGLSNHLLDTPWPKVTSGKAEMERLVAGPDVRVPDLLALLAPHEPTFAGTHHPDSNGRGNPGHVPGSAEAPSADKGNPGRPAETPSADEGNPAIPAGTPSAGAGGDLGHMRWRSSRFILGGAYGTRASTVALLDAAGAGIFVERSFDARGAVTGEFAERIPGYSISRRTEVRFPNGSGLFSRPRASPSPLR